jgi:hypothetical protein
MAKSKHKRIPNTVLKLPGKRDDPLREFSDICRRELESRCYSYLVSWGI